MTRFLSDLSDIVDGALGLKLRSRLNLTGAGETETHNRSRQALSSRVLERSSVSSYWAAVSRLDRLVRGKSTVYNVTQVQNLTGSVLGPTMSRAAGKGDTRGKPDVPWLGGSRRRYPTPV